MADAFLQSLHPRRAGIGDALARATPAPMRPTPPPMRPTPPPIPVPDDKETRREMHLLRRIAIGKAVRG